MDPIANFLTIIRNGYMARLERVTAVYSNMNKEVAFILKNKGFVEDYAVKTVESKKFLEITLSYKEGLPAIEHIKRISKPGLRVYEKTTRLRSPLSGLGLKIVSTSKGLMSNTDAKKRRLGGEVVCEVW